MYVNKTDYAGRISISLLDILIAENPGQIIADTGKEIEDIILTTVGVLYDAAAELSKTGNARNGYILNLAKSIGMYLIYQRADDEQVPDKVIKNYDDAMETLEKISNGKISLSLPPKPADPGTGGDSESPTPGGTGLRRMGSAPKRTHQI